MKRLTLLFISLWLVGASMAMWDWRDPNEKTNNFPDLTQITDRQSDSLALVALFDATDGDNWYKKTNWKSNQPIDTWFGVTTDSVINRVIKINLSHSIDSGMNFKGNNLKGYLPAIIDSLSKLEELLLYNNDIKRIESVGGLKKLKVLDLTFNDSISSIPGLEFLDSLEVLKIAIKDNIINEGLDTLPDLNRLKNLTQLTLSNNPKLGRLFNNGTLNFDSLNNLIGVRLARTGLTKIPYFPNPARLRTFSIGGGDQIPMSNLSVIDSMIGLQALAIVGFDSMINPPNLDFLIGNEGFTDLNLLDNPNLQSLPDLTGLSNLQSLNISKDTSLTNVSQISQLTNLITFIADHCNLVELPRLDSLKKIERFSVLDNKLRSFSGLDPDQTINRAFKIGNNRLPFDEMEPFLNEFKDTTNIFFPQNLIDTLEIHGVSLDSTLVLRQEDRGKYSRYQWYKVEDNDTIPISGAIGDTLLLENIELSDGGVYHVEITNDSFPGKKLITQPKEVKIDQHIPDKDPITNRRSVIIDYSRIPDSVRAEKKDTIVQALHKWGLVLADSCNCENYELWTVPDDISSSSDETDDPINYFGGETIVPLAGGNPKLRDTLHKVFWNYPQNVGVPRGDNNQWLASFPDTLIPRKQVNIAVIDFGIDSSHKDIRPGIWEDPLPSEGDTCYTTPTDPAKHGYNFAEHTTNPFWPDPIEGSITLGHATGIAGIIREILPNNMKDAIKIISLQVGSSQNKTGIFEVGCALRYAIDEGVDIINLSMGFYVGPDSFEVSPNDTFDIPLIDDLIVEAKSSNIIIVSSAGNEPTNNDKRPHLPSSNESSNLVTVGAIDPTNHKTAAPFSSYGPESVDIFAPGVNIDAPQPNQDRGKVSGSSISAAFVSAMLGIIMSANPNESIGYIINTLLYKDDRFSIEIPTLDTLCSTSRRLNIDLQDCNEKPYAREDIFTVALSQKILLPVIENDCYGDSVKVEMVLQIPGTHNTLGLSVSDMAIRIEPTATGTFQIKYQLIGVDTLNTPPFRDTAEILITVIDTPLDTISGSSTYYQGDTIRDVSYSAQEISLGTVFPIQEVPSFSFDLIPGSSLKIAPKRNEVDSLRMVGVDGGDLVAWNQDSIYEIGSCIGPRSRCHFQKIAANVNGDFFINTVDRHLIEQFILGEIDAFPFVEHIDTLQKTWSFVPDSYSFPDPFIEVRYPQSLSFTEVSPLTNQNFTGVKLGDINLDWAGVNRLRAPQSDPLEFNIPNIQTRTNQELSVPFTVKNFNDIASFQFTLEWDPALLDGVIIQADTYSPHLGKSKQGEGKVSFLWNAPKGKGNFLSADETIFTLSFLAKVDTNLQDLLNITNSITPARAYQATGIERIPLILRKEIDIPPRFRFRVPFIFNDSARMELDLPEMNTVTLYTKRLFGGRVWTWGETSRLPAGKHNMLWDGNDTNGLRARGLFFLVRLETENPQKTRTRNRLLLRF